MSASSLVDPSSSPEKRSVHVCIKTIEYFSIYSPRLPSRLRLCLESIKSLGIAFSCSVARSGSLNVDCSCCFTRTLALRMNGLISLTRLGDALPSLKDGVTGRDGIGLKSPRSVLSRISLRRRMELPAR